MELNYLSATVNTTNGVEYLDLYCKNETALFNETLILINYSNINSSMHINSDTLPYFIFTC
jgi:hypothetical protein